LARRKVQALMLQPPNTSMVSAEVKPYVLQTS